MTSEPWKHAFAQVNGLRLHYVTRGEGELVVLLHGFPQSWYCWRHQIPALAERFKVVAVDLRGYNQSDKPRGVASYRMGVLVSDVAELIRSFGEQKAFIVGHDWGGAVAWAFATDRPEATQRLVVLNCPHPEIFRKHLRSNIHQLLRSWYMFFFQIPRLPEWLIVTHRRFLIERTFRGLAIRKEAFSDADLKHYEEAIAQPGALTASINYYRAGLRMSLGRRKRPPAKIDCPTLLIWGEDDVALGKELTVDTECLVAGRFEIRYVPRCSHWVQEEQPHLVNRYLLEFLSDGTQD